MQTMQQTVKTSGLQVAWLEVFMHCLFSCLSCFVEDDYSSSSGQLSMRSFTVCSIPNKLTMQMDFLRTLPMACLFQELLLERCLIEPLGQNYCCH